jgi:hypothetical protein
MARLKAPQLRYERARHQRNSERYEQIWKYLYELTLALPNGVKVSIKSGENLDSLIDWMIERQPKNTHKYNT